LAKLLNLLRRDNAQSWEVQDILKDILAQKKEIKRNFKTLLDDAMDKAKEGLTSLDEIMRQL